MILTIAIPTFSRNQILRANLARLLPQITPECRLLILDNHSPEPVADTLADLLAEFPDVSAQVMRHRINIGGGGNIMRCFELCETPWLWVLGDDDEPMPDAVQTVLRTIRQHPQALYINFWCEHFGVPRPASYETRGRSEFIRRIDSFGTYQALSCCLFRVEALAEELQWGYHYVTTTAPHLVMVLKALGDQGACYISADPIVRYEKAPPDRHLSMMFFALWGQTLADLTMSHEERRVLTRAITGILPSVSVLLAEILVRVQKGDIDRKTAIYYFDQMYWRGLRWRSGLVNQIRNRVARVLVRWPWLAHRFMDSFFRLRTGMSLKSHPQTRGLPIITSRFR
jgi:glycosyltransferase involved in cell wall biosynthesis